MRVRPWSGDIRATIMERVTCSRLRTLQHLTMPHFPFKTLRVYKMSYSSHFLQRLQTKLGQTYLFVHLSQVSWGPSAEGARPWGWASPSACALRGRFVLFRAGGCISLTQFQKLVFTRPGPPPRHGSVSTVLQCFLSCVI